MEIKEAIKIEEKRYNRWLKWLDKSKITAKNKKILKDFIEYGLAKGLSQARLSMYLEKVGRIALLLNKDFKKANRKDMQKVMAYLRSKNYAQNTILTYQKLTKAFWRWLYNLDYNDPLPECVKWIKCEKAPSTLEKEHLLTEEEIAKMISTADKLQWKTLISVLAEGGLRPGELVNTKIGDVYVNEDHIRIKVAGKMRKKQGKREVILFKSYDLIVRWLDSYPIRDKKTNKPKLDTPLWIVKRNSHYEPFTITYLNILLKRIAIRSEISKRIYIYIFRHSHGTNLVKRHGEAIARMQLGHSPGSKTIATYTHLSEEDCYEALSGKLKQEEHNNKKCDRCGHFSSYNSTRCGNCGLAEDLTAIQPQLTEERVTEIVGNALKSVGFDIADIERVRA